MQGSDLLQVQQVFCTWVDCALPFIISFLPRNMAVRSF
uniref:Uncharacterized protein n=1 Tax=Anguilla anguilla TaxID=7936 RepID=A0A0E9QN17_ANGAN